MTDVAESKGSVLRNCEKETSVKKLSIEDVLEKSGESVEFLIDDPITCSYLKAFCDSQYCCENVNYIIEIGMYIDLFGSDAVLWRSSWKELDEKYGLKQLAIKDERLKELNDVEWPSSVVNKSEIESRIKMIWDTYLCERASTQICVPSLIFDNTIKRLKLLNLYGPHVFDETMIDPMKTLAKDIYPRFIVSEYFRELRKRVGFVTDLPFGSELQVPPPTDAPIVKNWTPGTIDVNVEEVDVMDTLNDSVLYGEFLSYLQSIVSAENLLCARMINVFKENFGRSNSSPTVSVEQAWTIFLHFVAESSSHEISLSYRRRKEVMLQLANPNLNTFDRVLKSAIEALSHHFVQYKKTPKYSSNLIHAAMVYGQSNGQGSNAKMFNCFGLSLK